MYAFRRNCILKETLPSKVLEALQLTNRPHYCLICGLTELWVQETPHFYRVPRLKGRLLPQNEAMRGGLVQRKKAYPLKRSWGETGPRGAKATLSA